ncbi:MAG: hypothetical protein U0793_11150 [Gemmataceae bacterium]
MMHKRRWCVSPVAAAEELAAMLTERTWTLCSGFYVQANPHYLFLNDATHEDGAAEFGVIAGGMDGPYVQIESITISWCTLDAALDYIRRTLAGEYDASNFARAINLAGRLDRPDQHRCPLCA